MTAYELVCRRLLEVTGYAVRNDSGRCPAHPDNNPSLSVTNGDGKVLLHCHAGCELDDVRAALGLEVSDLFDTPRSNGSDITTYDYVDEQRRLLFQVVRKPGKKFIQRRPDGNDGWTYKLGNTRRVPYRLPELVDGINAGNTVYIVEGGETDEVVVRAEIDAYQAGHEVRLVGTGRSSHR
jgi:hypothetical protein